MPGTTSKTLSATVTPSTSWDVGISVRGGASCAASTELTDSVGAAACADASGTGAETVTSVTVNAGSTYWIVIDGYTPTSSGAFSLSLTLQ